MLRYVILYYVGSASRQAAGPPDGDPVVLIHGFGVSSGAPDWFMMQYLGWPFV